MARAQARSAAALPIPAQTATYGSARQYCLATHIRHAAAASPTSIPAPAASIRPAMAAIIPMRLMPAGAYPIRPKPINGRAQRRIDRDHAETPARVPLWPRRQTSFFLPIRTASTVARGSRPAQLPSDGLIPQGESHGHAMRNTHGRRRQAGDRGHFVQKSASRSGFHRPECSVRRTGRPRVHRTWVLATSFTSTRLSPVSIYAGNFRLRKSTTMRPGRRGLDVAGTNRRRGIENDHLLAIARRGDVLPAPPGTWTAYSAQSCQPERPASPHPAQPSVGEKPYGGYARGVDKTRATPLLASDAQQLTRTHHVGRVHLAPDRLPIAGNRPPHA
jgi:hypothetical protein